MTTQATRTTVQRGALTQTARMGDSQLRESLETVLHRRRSKQISILLQNGVVEPADAGCMKGEGMW